MTKLSVSKQLRRPPVIVLLCGLALIAWAQIRTSLYPKSAALTEPVDLHKGKAFEREFIPNFSEPYRVTIDFKRNGKGFFGNPDITVTDDLGQRLEPIEVRHSTSDEGTDYWGPTLGRHLTEFNLVAQKPYRLKFVPEKDYPELLGADPHIIVRTRRNVTKFLMFQFVWIFGIGFVLALLSSSWLIGVWIFQRSNKRPSLASTNR